ncbi:hypothetical protein ACO2Q3_21585 [Caulobacter sp. KR2-114]|uniref:hypothetical protein n=1 Tax=Caulobacter sp. KR2-114 TaxID=3400912 RepID=UPI003C119EDD
MNAHALYWVGVCGGFFAIAAYFIALAMRPKWVRVLNGSALFFTGLGLMQMAIMIRTTSLGTGWFNANMAVLALLIAVVVQAYAVLRNRRAWDGVERRASPAAAQDKVEAEGGRQA